MSDDERPRRSWREIDRNKDRSSHRKEERRDSDDRRGGPRRERSYRAALDRLFDSGKIAELVEQKAPSSGSDKGGESRIKALATIKSAVGRDEVTRTVDAYLQQWDGLPDDVEILGQLLEHRNPTLQLDAMERIEQLLQQERPKRTRAMLGQLRMIRDVDDDPEMVALARRLIERLE